MIDLHCHLLPGFDDGPTDLEESLAMAEMAAADGIRIVACTPHILPGVYNNSGAAIQSAVVALHQAIRKRGIPLALVAGADAHVAPDMISRLRSRDVPTLHGSRYLLLEPPHHIAPPRLSDFTFRLLTAGYIPILTHPERLSWIEQQYDLIRHLAVSGVWMQLTAGSFCGQFGGRPRYWSERMLDEGLVDLLATDAHDISKRPPNLSRARDLVARRCGEAMADSFVIDSALAVLQDEPSAKRSRGHRTAHAAFDTAVARAQG